MSHWRDSPGRLILLSVAVVAVLALMGWIFFREESAPEVGDPGSLRVASSAPRNTADTDATPNPVVPAAIATEPQLSTENVVRIYAYDVLSGAGVPGCRFDFGETGAASTGDDGTASFDLRPGRYPVSVWPPAGWTKARAIDNAITVEAGGASVSVGLLPGIAICGTVVDTYGQGLSGAEVHFSGEGNYMHARDQSRSDGTFAITIAAGCADGRIQAQFQGKSSQLEGPFAVTDVVDGIVLTIRDDVELGAIAGVVVDEQQNPVDHIVVMASAQAEEVLPRIEGESDDSGQFILQHVAPGAYRLALLGVEGRPQPSDTPVVVEPGETADGLRLVYTAPDGLAISGTVERIDGTPVSHAHVDARRSDARASTSSGSDGAFTLTGLVPGTYEISALSEGYFRPTPIVPVKADAGSEGVVVTLEEAGTIYGEVVDNKSGKPVSAFEVQVTTEGALRPANAGKFKEFRSPEGRFEIEGLSPYGAAIFVRALGYFDSRVTIAESVSMPDGHVRVALEPADPIRGIVEDRSGQPVSGALIFADAVLLPGQRAENTVAKTGADGLFTIPGFSRETSMLYAYKLGYGLGQAAINGYDDFVRIRLEQGGTLKGRVTVGGDPPISATISPRPVDNPMNTSLQQNCDAVGNYTISNVTPGLYKVIAAVPSKGGMVFQDAEAEVQAGKATTLDFDFESVQATVTGVVTSGEELVVKGTVLIRVATPSGPSSRSGPIGSDGTYSIGPIAPGTASIQITGVTASGTQVDYTITAEIPEAEEVTLDLSVPVE